jgi:hypothetical protein
MNTLHNPTILVAVLKHVVSAEPQLINHGIQSLCHLLHYFKAWISETSRETIAIGQSNKQIRCMHSHEGDTNDVVLLHLTAFLTRADFRTVENASVESRSGLSILQSSCSSNHPDFARSDIARIRL